MTSDLRLLTFDASDPVALAAFWGGVLGREVVPAVSGGRSLVPNSETEFRLHFQPSDEPKRGPNQMHFDLTSETAEAQAAMVERVLELGGRHLDIGQGPDADHVVMADPEGNELCVLPAGNSFTAGCGTIGCLSSDGSMEVGHFWSAVLGWPLVWDQDEETAIQSPLGGSKISWGGPPYNARLGKNRLHLDLVPQADTDLESEVARLTALGATRADIGQGDVAWVVMADPDGNEFCVLPPTFAAPRTQG
ncbi:VOC family protein [Oryzobacter telluris]|uniref:VOC family protein n=1 Tax=Oryzobacter telluris TaxID=3149179 RepID=UPI00370D0F43